MSKKKPVIPFFEIAKVFESTLDGCGEARSFLDAKKPQTLKEMWDILVTGLRKAHAKGRTESAYMLALQSWTHFVLSTLHCGECVGCLQHSDIECPHCGSSIDLSDCNVATLVTYLDENPDPPFTEKEIRDHVRDYINEDQSELASDLLKEENE